MRNYLNSINPIFDSLFFDKNYDSRVMRTDIIEHDHEYILNIDMPDVEKKDISPTLLTTTTDTTERFPVK